MSSNLETPPLILAAGDIIRTMNREELRMLDDVIRDRYTQLNREAKRALDIGCTVEFTGKGKVTRGKVEKINPKTVYVVEQTVSGPRKWKCSPSLLTKVET